MLKNKVENTREYALAHALEYALEYALAVAPVNIDILLWSLWMWIFSASKVKKLFLDQIIFHIYFEKQLISVKYVLTLAIKVFKSDRRT